MNAFIHSFIPEFTDWSVVYTVAERVTNHKPMTLNGVTLDVEWLKPGRPPPLFTDVDAVSPDSLLFVDLPDDIDAEQLRDYAAKAASATVDQMMFSPQPGVALVQYSAPIGLSASLCILAILPFYQQV